MLRADADAQVADDRAQGSAAVRDLWLILGISVVVGAGLALVVVRQITGTVAAVQRSLDALAAVTSPRRPTCSSRDELGRMAASLATAQENLRTVLSGVVASADAVAASSEELSASAAQISASAEETSAQSGVVSGAAEEVSPQRADGRRGRRGDGRLASGRSPRTPPRRPRWPAGRSPPPRARPPTVAKLGAARPRSATSSR